MRFYEKDIRPEKLIRAVRVFISKDRKLILKNKKNFVKVLCPACQSKNEKFFLRKKGFRYSICINCATYYMNPRPTVKILENFYKNSESYRFWNKFIFPATEKIRRKKIFQPRVIECIKFCKNNNYSLDSILSIYKKLFNEI